MNTTTGLTSQDWHSRATQLKHAAGHFIDGAHVASRKGATFTVTNPATGEPLCEAAAGGAEEIDRAVASCRKSFKSGVWRYMTPRDRLAVLQRCAQLIEANVERFALLDTVC